MTARSEPTGARGRPQVDLLRFIWVLFVVGAVCQYVGAAIAVPLFDSADPAVIAWLRTVAGGVVLVAITRPDWLLRDRRRLARATMFGVVTTGMNIAFYLAISTIDLGVAVAIEFIGPIAVAAVSARGVRGVASLAAVIVGVVLVSGATPSGSIVGVVLALTAGGLWAGYIVLGARVSGATAAVTGGARRWRSGVEDLGVGLAVAGLLSAPFVLGVSEITGGTGLSLGVIAAGAAVGILSSAIPYVLDQVVLTRIGRGRFALMLALLPATAAVVGAVVLAQIPTAAEIVGIAVVIAAIALSAGGDGAGGDGNGGAPVAPWRAMTDSTTTPPGPLVHMCPKPDWVRAHAQGRLEPASLEQAGFIHLSALSQVHIPADALFRGRSDLVLLEIDAARVPADIVWEDGDPPHPDGLQFPHLYGPLPVTAVVRVHDYLPGADGTFEPRTTLDAS